MPAGGNRLPALPLCLKAVVLTMSSTCPPLDPARSGSAAVACAPVSYASVSSTPHVALQLLAVCLAALAMPLSFTGPAVALPALRDALGGSPVQMAWVTNAFMLSFGATLMACGALADAWGRKRVFLCGVGVVAVSAVGLASAGSIVAFNLWRAVQGVGAAAALAGGTSALAQAIQGPARLRAFSWVGTAFGVGLAFGPLLAGWLLGHGGWRAVVLCVAGVAMVAGVAGARFLRDSRDPAAAGLDLPGAASFTAALALLTLGVLQAPESGWASLPVLAALAGSVAMAGVFVRTERRVRHPMLDLSLFRYPRFVGVQLLAAAPAYAFVVLLVLLPVRFIGVEGLSALATGQLMLALSGAMLFVPLAAGWLARWWSPAALSAGGLAVCAVGLWWLSDCPPGSPAAVLVGPLALIGVGIGLPWGLMDGLAVSVVPPERAGMATGIFNTVRVAGEGLALALVGAGLVALVALQWPQVPGADALRAGQYLVAGDLPHALRLLPGLSQADVLQAYGRAFSTLLRVLAGVTVFTAVAVFACLRLGAARGAAVSTIEG
ncbi:Sugar phosphate permease [Paracidovorax valerianellae]|uniref:Sugar phosphate permease n=2 Tax=Paracidovorax valerianellae TaxID=187868 RepID=A0A1G6PD51_9BURK|nr:Sugar phosphate permease [Paracidovorax valerianellae]